MHADFAVRVFEDCNEHWSSEAGLVHAASAIGKSKHPAYKAAHPRAPAGTAGGRVRRAKSHATVGLRCTASSKARMVPRLPTSTKDK